MRLLLTFLAWSVAVAGAAAPKNPKKSANRASPEDDLRMWDDSVADVSWVNENTETVRPRPARGRAVERDWFSLNVTGGLRVFQLDAPMIQADEFEQPINEGEFNDLIETKHSFEVRALLHPFSFLTVGAAYHTDESRLKIQSESVPIAPQEFLGLVQVGPRFGFVRLYGFYSQIFSSQSQASINAATRAGAAENMQTFKIDVKQKGGEAGLGTAFYWGPLGFHAEGVRSVNRTYDLTMTDADGNRTFRASARPSFQAWQFGLSLNF